MQFRVQDVYLGECFGSASMERKGRVQTGQRTSEAVVHVCRPELTAWELQGGLSHLSCLHQSKIQ